MVVIYRSRRTASWMTANFSYETRAFKVAPLLQGACVAKEFKAATQSILAFADRAQAKVAHISLDDTVGVCPIYHIVI